MRRIAKLLPYLGILLLLLVGLLIFLQSGPVTRHLRGAVTGELARQTGRSVSIGDVSVSLSGRAVLHDLAIKNQDGSLLLSAPTVTARVGGKRGMLSLLSGPVEITAVTLERPTLSLARSGDGSLNIQDLMERKPTGRPFRGTVVVKQGRVKFVDGVMGGAVTELDRVDLTVRPGGEGKTGFKIRGEGMDGAFDLLEAQGETSAKAGTQVTGRIRNVDVPYALGRLPKTSAMSVAAGRADVRGEVKLGAKGSPRPEASYDVKIEAREGEVSFPWLRRPVKEVAGKGRFADGKIELTEVTGSVEEAPVKVSGTIALTPKSEVALDILASGLRVKQVKALLPNIYVPAALLLPAPVRIEARAEGPTSDVEVTGRATVRAVKFRLVPWQDVVAKFRYRRGRLSISGLSAHGSPRRLDADVDISWGKGKTEAAAGFRLLKVPVPLLAQMAGIEVPDLRGTASLVGNVELKGLVPSISGRITIENASFRQVPMGRLEARFDYSGKTVKVREGRVKGALGSGTFSGDVTLPDRYRANVSLDSVNLALAGELLQRPELTGSCPAKGSISGILSKGTASGQFRLGPGEVAGQRFGSASAEFEMSREDLSFRRAQFSQGESKWEGQLQIRGRQRSDGGRLSGEVKVSRFYPREWLPLQWRGWVRDIALDGSASVGGTVVSPEAKTDLKIGMALGNGFVIDLGHARLSYRNDQLTVEEAMVTDGRSRVEVSGSYRKKTGADVEVVGGPLDLDSLAAEARRRYGLAVSGEMQVRAHVSGPLEALEVRFKAASDEILVNEVPIEAVSLRGTVSGGVLHLEDVYLEQARTRAKAQGEVGLTSDRLDMTWELAQVDLFTLQRLVDSAVSRLDWQGSPIPYRDLYIAIPERVRPLGGSLNAAVRLRGSTRNPRAEVGVLLQGLQFAGRKLDSVCGGLELSGRESRISLEALHEQARANLSGYWRTGADIFLQADVNNLDLGLVGPWLGAEADIGGTATINFDISGETARPLLRGDVSVRDLRLGAMEFEAADANPIRMDIGGVLTVEEMWLRDGALEGTGSVQIPLNLGGGRKGEPEGARPEVTPTAELHVKNVSLAPLPGMKPAVFDASLFLEGNRLWLETPPGREGEGVAGVTGVMGKGTFTVNGGVDLRSYSLSDWGRNRFDVMAELEGLEVDVPGMISGRVDGSLVLTSETASGRALLGTPEGKPLVLSQATLGIPQTAPDLSGASLASAPVDLGVEVMVGEEVWFRYGSRDRPTAIKIEPDQAVSQGDGVSRLRVGGALSAAGYTLDGDFESREGVLALPNGLLTLRAGRARVLRDAGQLPRVDISGEADGRIGDYYISIRPRGQAYPPPAVPMSLNAVSYPYLEEGYITALLLGPLVTPTRGAGEGFTSMLAGPGGNGVGSGELTGIRFPPLGGAFGMEELSLDLTLRGPVRLRVGERIFDRVVVSYVSALSGPGESRTLRFTYEVGRRASLGWSVDEFDRSRWEVQSFIPF